MGKQATHELITAAVGAVGKQATCELIGAAMWFTVGKVHVGGRLLLGQGLFRCFRFSFSLGVLTSGLPSCHGPRVTNTPHDVFLYKMDIVYSIQKRTPQLIQLVLLL